MFNLIRVTTPTPLLKQKSSIAHVVDMRINQEMSWHDIVHFCKINDLAAEDIAITIQKNLPFKYWPSTIKKLIQL